MSLHDSFKEWLKLAEDGDDGFANLGMSPMMVKGELIKKKKVGRLPKYTFAGNDPPEDTKLDPG